MRHVMNIDRPMKIWSPSGEGRSGGAFDTDSTFFVSSPALLTIPAAAVDAGKTLARHIHKLGWFKISNEKNFYEPATRISPTFSERICGAGDDMTASELFGRDAAITALWDLPMETKPKLCVRASVPEDGSEKVFHAGWNGEIESLASNTTLRQAVTFAAMDTVRVFFPRSRLGASGEEGRLRRFFSFPPVGFAVVGFPYLGCILATEWIGALLVSVVSPLFVLGGEEHKSAVEALPKPNYGHKPFIELDVNEGEPWVSPSLGQPLAGKVLWRVNSGRFQKLIRFDAYPAPRFHSMARVYARLQELHASGKRDPGDVVITDARLWCGEHQLLVDMKAVAAVGGIDDETPPFPSSSSMYRELTDEELLRADGQVARKVADAIVWLATNGIIYTDVRGPNVLIAGGSGDIDSNSSNSSDAAAEIKMKLVDYDDCFVTSSPVTTSVAFQKAMVNHVKEAQDEEGLGMAMPVAQFARAVASESVAVEFQQFWLAIQAAFDRVSAHSL
jgi:hypothetical protein